MRYAEYAISTGKGVKGHSRTLAQARVLSQTSAWVEG